MEEERAYDNDLAQRIESIRNLYRLTERGIPKDLSDKIELAILSSTQAILRSFGITGSSDIETPSSLVGKAYMLAAGPRELTVEDARKYLKDIDYWLFDFPDDFDVSVTKEHGTLPEADVVLEERVKMKTDLKKTAHTPFLLSASWPGRSNTPTASKLHKFYHRVINPVEEGFDPETPFIHDDYWCPDVFWSQTRKGKTGWFAGDFALGVFGYPT